jgi:hypothetical protein
MADESERDKVLHRVLGHVPPDRTSVPSDDRTVVHVVHEGRALCGKPGAPSSWGLEHKWVRRDSDEDGPRSAVNCPVCRQCLVQRRIMLASTAPFKPAELPVIGMAECTPSEVSVVARGVYVDADGNEQVLHVGGWDPFEPEQPTTLEGHERAVLAELELIPDHTLQSWIDRSFFTVMGLAKKELARRRFARANPAPPPIEADFPEPKPDLPRTRELLRRFVAKWNASEQDPRTLGGEVDFDLLADIADAFEAEDLND